MTHQLSLGVNRSLQGWVNSVFCVNSFPAVPRAPLPGSRSETPTFLSPLPAPPAASPKWDYTVIVWCCLTLFHVTQLLFNICQWNFEVYDYSCFKILHVLLTRVENQRTNLLILIVISCPANDKIKKAVIYLLPQVSKSVVGRWVGDQNSEMLPCTLITEENLD